MVRLKRRKAKCNRCISQSSASGGVGTGQLRKDIRAMGQSCSSNMMKNCGAVSLDAAVRALVLRARRGCKRRWWILAPATRANQLAQRARAVAKQFKASNVRQVVESG